MIRSDTMTSLYLYSYDHPQPDHLHFIVYRVRAVMDTATIATETMQQITAIEEFHHQGAKIKTKWKEWWPVSSWVSSGCLNERLNLYQNGLLQALQQPSWRLRQGRIPGIWKKHPQILIRFVNFLVNTIVFTILTCFGYFSTQLPSSCPTHKEYFALFVANVNLEAKWKC